MAYTDLTNSWEYAKPVFRAKMELLAENDEYLKNHGWQTGTKAVFLNSAPSGWTLSAGLDSSFLRIVDGVVGVGGASGGSYPIASYAPLNFSHNHTLNNADSHTHNGASAHTHVFNRSASDNASAPVDSHNIHKKADGFFGRTIIHGGSPYVDNRISPNQFTTVIETAPSGTGGDHTHTTGLAATTSFIPYYLNIVIAQKDTSSGYTDLTNFFYYGQWIIDTIFETMYDNDNYNKNRIMPTNAIMFLHNNAIPQAWQKLNIPAYGDRGLRVASDIITGGNVPIGTQLSLFHNHSVSSSGNHSHTVPQHRHTVTTQSPSYFDDQESGQIAVKEASNEIQFYGAGATTKDQVKTETEFNSGVPSTDVNYPSSNLDHTHTIASGPSSPISYLQFAYVDVNLIQKVAGSPTFSFTDFTTLLAFKKLVSRQKLNIIGKNDEHIRYHQMSTGSQMVFYQASAPLNWTMATHISNRILRTTMGSPGGQGGLHPIGTTFNFAHVHTVGSNSQHTHGFTSHSHDWKVVSGAVAGSATGYYMGYGGVGSTMITVKKDSITNDRTHLATPVASTGTVTMDYRAGHTHVMVSGGAPVDFRYSNVILCTKD